MQAQVSLKDSITHTFTKDVLLNNMAANDDLVKDVATILISAAGKITLTGEARPIILKGPIDASESSEDIEIIKKLTDNEDMNTVSESLLNAKLEAAEARTEARVVRLETLVENSIKNNERAITEFKIVAVETQNEIKKSKNALILWVAGIAASSVFSLWAINNSLISTIQSSFGMGQQSRETIQHEVSTQNQSLTAKTNELTLKADELAVKTDTLGNKLDKIAEKLDSLSIQNR